MSKQRTMVFWAGLDGDRGQRARPLYYTEFLKGLVPLIVGLLLAQETLIETEDRRIYLSEEGTIIAKGILKMYQGLRIIILLLNELEILKYRGENYMAQITPEELAEAEDVEIKEETEYWNTYKLGDGTTLRIKLVVTGIKRLAKWTPDGSPIYAVNSQNIIRLVIVPKELKAKAKIPTMKPV